MVMLPHYVSISSMLLTIVKCIGKVEILFPTRANKRNWEQKRQTMDRVSRSKGPWMTGSENQNTVNHDP
jgi:hypothetical protein